MGLLDRFINPCYRVILTDTQVNKIVEEGRVANGFTQAELEAICFERGSHSWELSQTEEGIVDVCLVCGMGAVSL